MIYEFNSEDVEDLNEERLRFYRLNESILISSGIIIEGIELINDDFYGPIIAKASLKLPQKSSLFQTYYWLNLKLELNFESEFFEINNFIFNASSLSNMKQDDNRVLSITTSVCEKFALFVHRIGHSAENVIIQCKQNQMYSLK